MKIEIRSRFEGALLGLALGDACGAPYEGGVLERLAWRLITIRAGGELRWTDDTQLSLCTAESILAMGRIDPDDLAKRFSRAYRWSRGYGPGMAKVLKRIARGEHWERASVSVYSGGSFGNGGAMRSPVVGLYCWQRPETLRDSIVASVRTTHAHPLAIEGALIVATATMMAVSGATTDAIRDEVAKCCVSGPFSTRMQIVRRWLSEGHDTHPREVVRRLGNGISAMESCMTAVYLALRFMDSPFQDMLGFAKNCGGDVDTISAMSGAIWGAGNGVDGLPSADLDRLEERDVIVGLSRDLCTLSMMAQA
ncbi:MAG: ADP-ribosylglycohydrolase family protein [Xanthomonadaceae bacterium]|nr:ADP-ribosylglycohydrolase family protein [Xanthomonadaceae bacterium]